MLSGHALYIAMLNNFLVSEPPSARLHLYDIVYTQDLPQKKISYYAV